MEPMSALTAAAGRAAGTAAMRAFQRDGRIRLGGREERRIVYGHFQLCAFRVYSGRSDLARASRWPYMVTFWIPASFALRRTTLAQRELDEAFAELTLAGNTDPVAAGTRLFHAAIGMNLDYDPDHSKNAGVQRKFLNARDEFVEAARQDLWYLPQWWQVWRPAWWGVRWRSLKGQRRAKREHKSGS
ncbi:hypothetical protein ACFV6B_29175 [Streptomyces microflavus]|uniref:hypothetical protein n=1 Tax=Streptomyces microflavus TaxID=1919 RepID=UPI00365A9A62